MLRCGQAIPNRFAMAKGRRGPTILSFVAFPHPLTSRRDKRLSSPRPSTAVPELPSSRPEPRRSVQAFFRSFPPLAAK
jgi:hypothetical protein